MADKMLRVAARGQDGTAKPLNVNRKGNLKVENVQKYHDLIGDFEEPYEQGYIGNVTVSGLEVFNKIELNSEIRDAKLGKSGIYVADAMRLFKYDTDHDELIWVYTGFNGTQIDFIFVDGNDDVFIIGQYLTAANHPQYRHIEKINGTTGERIWRVVENYSNYIFANDAVVDVNGDIYVSGRYDGFKYNDGHVKKYSGVDGSVLWEFKYTAATQTLQWFVTLDRYGYVYLSHVNGIVKLNQKTANATVPPTVEWDYIYRHADAFGGNMYITVDFYGYIYRVERVYRNLAHGNIVVKLDASSGLPVKVWEKEIAQVDKFSRIFIDEHGALYQNTLGKLKSNGEALWGDAPPFAITDARDDVLLGFKATKGYNHETKYTLYKAGKNLKPNYVLGVK